MWKTFCIGGDPGVGCYPSLLPKGNYNPTLNYHSYGTAKWASSRRKSSDQSRRSPSSKVPSVQWTLSATRPTPLVVQTVGLRESAGGCFWVGQKRRDSGRSTSRGLNGKRETVQVSYLPSRVLPLQCRGVGPDVDPSPVPVPYLVPGVRS